MDLFYLPPISEFKKIATVEDMYFPVQQPFRKMSFHNRSIIASANGLINLSIPVKGGREVKGSLQEIRIDNSQSWQIRQWRTITSAYGRSPWFEFFEPSLKPYFSKEYECLSDWNMDLLKWVCKASGLTVNLHFSFEEALQTASLIKTSNYKNAEFSEGIKPYYQVFQERIGFQVNLSIIDLLFNEGKHGFRSILT